MTKHANVSLHHNYPKYEYNNQSTRTIWKSYDPVQLTPEYLLHILSSLKILVNNLRYTQKGFLKERFPISPALVTAG